MLGRRLTYQARGPFSYLAYLHGDMRSIVARGLTARRHLVGEARRCAGAAVLPYLDPPQCFGPPVPRIAMRLFSTLFAFALLIAGCSRPAEVPFTTSLLFSDGAVLQRGIAVPVWGTATPGTTVRIALNDDAQEVAADADGAWRVELAPQVAGGPYTLTIVTPDMTHQAQDVWFGDVWVASGQSNMEWRVRASMDAEQEIRAASDAQLRHYKVPLTWSFEPESSLAGGQWHSTDSTTVGDFSAVGYYFARELRAATGVPIGILNTSWGGSRIEAWLDINSQLEDSAAVQRGLLAALAKDDSLAQIFEASRNAPGTEDPGMVEGAAVWADPDLDDTDWADMPAPALWEAHGFEGLSGYVWYRGTLTLTEVQAGAATLKLSMVDDRDQTYVNGTLVGETGRFRVPRTYEIPAGILQPGENSIVIRVRDTGGNGGIIESDHPFQLETPGGIVPLPDTWKFRVGEYFVDAAGNPNQQATLLYNKMVHPILPFPVTGFIWYQGESNAFATEDAKAYRAQFQKLITRWRALWQNESAPFLFVSLANFRASQGEPGESDWALLRESQSAAVALHNVGQAITIDIGEANDIHPRNKQDVGWRLALAARHFAYGETLTYSGPTYASHAIEGNEVHIAFDHIGDGLMIKGGGRLGGFAIAGADGRFVWADARVYGDKVIVSSPAVAEPAAVRYAWADNPDKANLFNRNGLPAAPFRTDGD